MSVSPDDYRSAIGRFATGVAVVTATGPAGPAGLTTNAVTSLSLDPLLLLVCFDNTSRTLAAVKATRRFAVNILSASQRDLAAVFASKVVQTEKFESASHRIEHDLPVLDDALAWFACNAVDLIPGGDHTIGIGAVEHVYESPDGEPLLFYEGIYSERAVGA